MALTVLCPECFELVKYTPVDFNKKYTVRDEDIEIKAKMGKCQNCGKTIPIRELEEQNYQKVYSEYRQRKNLMQPSEIKQLRGQYGISQRLLAKLLGWSHVTLSRYESGAVQEFSHNNQLVLLKNPENLLELLARNQNNLTIKEYNRLKEKAEILLNNTKATNLFLAIEKYYTSNKPSKLTGFKKFCSEKFINMVKFFASKDPELLKVKLMKYLWYSDFLNFKRYTVSISGLRYVHLPLGPVPEDYEILLSLALKDDVRVEPYIVHNYVGEKYTAGSAFDRKLFTPEEIETMSFIVRFFKGFTSKRISEYSHNEKAYQMTNNADIIPYDLALELSLD